MQKVQPSRVFSGARLKRAQEEAGLNGGDIYRGTGLHQNLISAYVRGHYTPGTENLVLLADFLDCDINDFFTEVDDVA